MGKPKTCPEEIYELMLKMWEFEPINRPTFAIISSTLFKLAPENKLEAPMTSSNNNDLYHAI